MPEEGVLHVRQRMTNSCTAQRLASLQDLAHVSGIFVQKCACLPGERMSHSFLLLGLLQCAGAGGHPLILILFGTFLHVMPAENEGTVPQMPVIRR